MTQTSAPLAIEHHLVQTNGVTLHVVQLGPKEGELVILLHGFPEFWYGWRRQADALAKAGFRVWVPDQRGYNLSEKPSGIAAYAVETLARDIVGLIDAAGRERAYVAGHDWGAAVTWALAVFHPERLHKIAILNVPHPVPFRKAITSNTGQMLKSWYIGYFQIPGLPEIALQMGGGMMASRALTGSSRPGTFTDADISEYLTAWSQPGAWTGMINWYRALRLPITQPASWRVAVPTLIIWGAKDAFLDVTLAEQSAALCDTVKLVKFDQATHWVQHEEAYQVSALLREWFGAE